MRAKVSLLGFYCSLLCFAAAGQSDSIPEPAQAKVGIFIPLHLDSVFTSSGSYKYNSSIPKYVMPGLEFYSGVQLALDSLRKEGLNAEVFIIDSKDRYQSMSSHIADDLDHAALLIGMVQSVTELKILSDAAYNRSIPFISATYPNDGGLTGNPSLIILNSTLRSHCQGIYKLLANSYSLDNIIVLSKSGVQEDRMKAVLEEANKNSNSSLKWKKADISNGINTEDLAALMDSTKNNVVVCATLDETLGMSIIRELSSLRNPYRSSIIGMPTWDDFKFEKAEFKGVEIMYPTPFLTSSGNSRVYNSVSNKYRARAKSRASDMVYKGFEITYRYIKNMLSHQDHIVDLSDHTGKIFSDFDLEPVKIRTTKNEPDYYENKKVYFVKKLDGVVKGIF
ncbi:MAG: hypothetical protein ABIX01_15970 [Chitinophagaceae bacterium]